MKVAIKIKDIEELFVLEEEGTQGLFEHNVHSGHYYNYKFKRDMFQSSKKYKIEFKFKFSEVIEVN